MKQVILAITLCTLAGTLQAEAPSAPTANTTLSIEVKKDLTGTALKLAEFQDKRGKAVEALAKNPNDAQAKINLENAEKAIATLIGQPTKEEKDAFEAAKSKLK